MGAMFDQPFLADKETFYVKWRWARKIARYPKHADDDLSTFREASGRFRRIDPKMTSSIGAARRCNLPVVTNLSNRELDARWS
jgi:hypothetical protein